jgi:hypothetical protein
MMMMMVMMMMMLMMMVVMMMMLMLMMMMMVMTDECIDFHILSNTNGHQTVLWRVSLQSCTGPAREAIITIPDQACDTATTSLLLSGVGKNSGET